MRVISSTCRSANSSQLKVGDFVVAIGNPFGLGQTATSGIVSALGRGGLKVGGYEDFIQTDASINPGNSGGALVDLHGELVGINSAILSPGGGNIGIGFAVPSNMAHAVMEQLIRFGEVRRGRLGVVVQDVTPDMTESLNLTAAQGALVTQVENGSPAERAGIRSGDVIVAVDGQPVTTATDLRNRLGLVPLGERVEVDLMRRGRPLSVSASVGNRRGARPDARMARLCIFDCDGTLVDSQHEIIAAMQRAFTASGLAEPTAGAIRHIVGLSLRDAVLALLP